MIERVCVNKTGPKVAFCAKSNQTNTNFLLPLKLKNNITILDTQHYKSVVIINNKANINSIADLRGKRSCHGAYNSTPGWNIPVGLLLATLTMPPDCHGELNSVSKFFDQSCAPGKFIFASLPFLLAPLKFHPCTPNSTSLAYHANESSFSSVQAIREAPRLTCYVW